MTALPRIYLPWTKTSALSANSRKHWAAKGRLIRAQRRTADALAREAGWHKITVPAGASVALTLTYCPPSRGGIPDDDNVITANKGARDALAAVLRIDDRHMTCRAVLGSRCKLGAVILDAEIVPAAAHPFQSIGDLAAQTVDRAVAIKRAAE